MLTVSSFVLTVHVQVLGADYDIHVRHVIEQVAEKVDLGNGSFC